MKAHNWDWQRQMGWGAGGAGGDRQSWLVTYLAELECILSIWEGGVDVDGQQGDKDGDKIGDDETGNLVYLRMRKAKLFRSILSLSCLSPLHCLLHLAFGIPTFQSMCFHTFRVLPDIRNIWGDWGLGSLIRCKDASNKLKWMSWFFLLESVAPVPARSNVTQNTKFQDSRPRGPRRNPVAPWALWPLWSDPCFPSPPLSLCFPFSSNITQAPPSAPATGAFFRTGPITEDSSGSSRTTQLRAIHPSPSARSCPQRQSWRLLDGFWWEFAFQRLPSQGAATHEGLLAVDYTRSFSFNSTAWIRRSKRWPGRDL